jgi:hypothetical protein
MASSAGDDVDADVARLVEQASELRERLRRTTLALELCEEALGDIFDRMANRDAKVRARITARECRAFAARLAAL